MLHELVFDREESQLADSARQSLVPEVCLAPGTPQHDGDDGSRDDSKKLGNKSQVVSPAPSGLFARECYPSLCTPK